MSTPRLAQRRSDWGLRRGTVESRTPKVGGLSMLTIPYPDFHCEGCSSAVLLSSVGAFGATQLVESPYPQQSGGVSMRTGHILRDPSRLRSLFIGRSAGIFASCREFSTPDRLSHSSGAVN